MKNTNKIKKGNMGVTIILYILVTLFAFVALYPMYYVLILSVSEAKYAATMDVYFLPKGIDFTAYKLLVQNEGLWRAYGNSILYVVCNTILMLLTTIPVAYGLSYKKLIGRKFLTVFLLIPMYFSGGLIPTYLVLVKLGLYDNPLAMIIPTCFSIWNIILVRSFFRTIPHSLVEAAKIDGASIIQVLLNVFIPLGKAIFAVIAVYTIVGVWNSWFRASVYLPHKEWQPVQLYLRRLLVESSGRVADELDPVAQKEAAMRQLSNAQLKYAMIIFASIPAMITYPFFQKYFVKGIVVGSLKE